MHPALHHDAKAFERMRRYLANGRYSHDEARSFAARVFGNGALMLEPGGHAGGRSRSCVDTYEPHEPWTPPRKYIDLYGDPDHRGRSRGCRATGRSTSWSRGDASALVSRMHALYAAEVTMTDRWLGFFLDRLHDLGLERDTAIVLVGDHGFMFGEYGYTGKISSLAPPGADAGAAGGRGPRAGGAPGARATISRRRMTWPRRCCRSRACARPGT